MLGNSKALTSTAKRRVIRAAERFPFLRRHDRCHWGDGNDGNGSNSGHVRIYAWNSATSAWEQQGADIDGEAADDYSGYSVSLSSDGTTVAIGAIVTTATALAPVTCGCILFRVLRLLKAALMRTGRTIILKRMSTTARASYTAVPLQMLVTMIRKQQAMTALVFFIAPDVRMR